MCQSPHQTAEVNLCHCLYDLGYRYEMLLSCTPDVVDFRKPFWQPPSLFSSRRVGTALPIVFMTADPSCGQLLLAEHKRASASSEPPFLLKPFIRVTNLNTPGFGYMVFGYMVFLALFRLYGQWSIRSIRTYGHFGYMVNFTRTKPWTIYPKPGVLSYYKRFNTGNGDVLPCVGCNQLPFRVTVLIVTHNT